MSNSGYLLIADISGYTNFVKLHNLRQKNVLGKIIADNFEFHAEAIVSDLLEAVIEVIEPTLKLNKLEGDAAFFYIESNDNKNQADDIISIMDKANESFNEKASSLVFVRACGCEPCLESKNLRLKIVAHKGNFAIKKIRNFEELAGEDVIFTHRMLKNGIENNEYWLVTDSFYKDLNPSNKALISPVCLIIRLLTLNMSSPNLSFATCNVIATSLAKYLAISSTPFSFTFSRLLLCDFFSSSSFKFFIKFITFSSPPSDLI